ncbi:hypothetical protein WMY93_022345 [Mugilogobius chulae]|uniref:Uncharacterized protein n=1 Tax=Mugilogobius chulae TaxID=88201 RepID=A0AAW0N9Q0_9GOBI
MSPKAREEGGFGERETVRKCARSPRSPSFPAPAPSLQHLFLFSPPLTPSRVLGLIRRSRGASRVSPGGPPAGSGGVRSRCHVRFLPGFVSTASENHGQERRERRGSTRSRMPVMRGLIAPQTPSWTPSPLASTGHVSK